MLVWVGPVAEFDGIAKRWTQSQANEMKVCQDLRLAEKVINVDVFLIHLIFLSSLWRLVEFKYVVTVRPPVIPTAMEGEYVVFTACNGIRT
jgi:hypothetical protein